MGTRDTTSASVSSRLGARALRTRAGTTIAVAVVNRRARRIVEPVNRVAHDRRVHRETQRAANSASKAARRVQRVGVSRALTDRRVARNLRRSSHHASKAASLVVHPTRSHRIRNAALALAGGVLGGAAYAGWRRTSHTAEAANDSALQGFAGNDAAGTDPAVGEPAGSDPAVKGSAD